MPALEALAFVASLSTAGAREISISAGGSSAMSKNVISDPRSQWLGYLHVTAATALEPTQGLRVRHFWRALEEHLGASIIPPRAAPRNGSFSMFWDRGRHHFEIEILPEGNFDWFYMDRESDRRAGDEGLRVGHYPAQMLGALRLTLGAAKE